MGTRIREKLGPFARVLSPSGFVAAYIGVFVGLVLAGHAWAWVGLFFLFEVTWLAFEFEDDRQMKEDD